MTDPKSVRNLFIAVLIFLPLQYGLVGLIGLYNSEPWPAFVFPGFKSVHVYDESFQISQTRFEIIFSNDADRVVLQPGDFFKDLPLSQIPGFIRTHFSDPEQIQSFDRETRRWLQHQAENITARLPEALEIAATHEFYSFRDGEAVRDSVITSWQTYIEF